MQTYFAIPEDENHTVQVLFCYWCGHQGGTHFVTAEQVGPNSLMYCYRECHVRDCSCEGFFPDPVGPEFSQTRLI